MKGFRSTANWLAPRRAFVKAFVITGSLSLMQIGDVWSAVKVAGSSVEEILSASTSLAASIYEIGFFGDASVPDSDSDWDDFTVISSISPKELGKLDQNNEDTPEPGQFGFSDELGSRDEIGLTQASDYSRRLGIRFFDSSGNESNIVTAGNNDWLLRDPDGVASLPADLSLGDADLVWGKGAVSAFKTVADQVVEGKPIRVVSSNHNGLEFSMKVTDLDPDKTYVFRRGIDLQSFETTIGDPFDGGSDHEFVDPAPPAVRAFYRVEVLARP